MLFDPDHPAFDHAVVHQDVHAGCVRVVPDADTQHGIDDLEVLFPRELVLSTPLGCGHTCVYTDGASAAVVAARIAEHLRDVEHLS
jgi:hypothetical protein